MTIKKILLSSALKRQRSITRAALLGLLLVPSFATDFVEAMCVTDFAEDGDVYSKGEAMSKRLFEMPKGSPELKIQAGQFQKGVPLIIDSEKNLEAFCLNFSQWDFNHLECMEIKNIDFSHFDIIFSNFILVKLAALHVQVRFVDCILEQNVAKIRDEYLEMQDGNPDGLWISRFERI